MPYTKEIFEKAQAIIERRKADAENAAEAKRRMFDSLEPDYKKWKNEMILSVRDVIKAIDMNPLDSPKFIQEQKMRNLNAQQEIKLLLRKNNLADDYLEVHYSCPKCNDSGVDGSHLCECHIELLKKLAFDEAGEKSPLKFCSFEDFKLEYYSDKYEKETASSPRDRMFSIFEYCKIYAASFETSTSPSLIFSGETGLGKTHLSLAIAGEVIKKGNKVLYNSAQNIFNELQKDRFSKNSDGQYEALILECDLLVIDDLGAEFPTSFTQAALYNIINTRINLCLPTIISTNLDHKELEEAYGRRIASRLIGEYSTLYFSGTDIRQKKNED